MAEATPWIRFDRRGPSLVDNDLQNGLTIERGLQILDFPIANKAGTSSDPMVLLRALAMVGTGPGDYVTRFPQLEDTYPPPDAGDPDFTFCTVVRQRIVGLDNTRRILEASIRYHSPIGPQSPGIITYTVDDDNQQAFVRTYVTADGSQGLTGWYQPALNPTQRITHFPSPQSPNNIIGTEVPLASVLPAPAQKLITYRVIRAIGQTTKDTWDSIKGPYHAARGMINSDVSGPWAPRGTWMYLGPKVTTHKGGATGTVVHTVMEGVGTARWFPILPFMNQHGEHPADSASEAELQVAIGSPGFPPPVGSQIRISGLTMASVQLETDFLSLFGTDFSP